GIHLLTLGRLEAMQRLIVEELVEEGMRVLEVGCGTGALTVAMAKAGANVSAIDISPGMLAEAAKRIKKEDVEEHVDLQRMDAVMLDELFDPQSFDLIVSSLALSENTERGRRFILKATRKLLAPDGKLAVLDEVRPTSGISRLLFTIVRAPLQLLTWLLTRTTTHPLVDFEGVLSSSGFDWNLLSAELAGSLRLYLAAPVEQDESDLKPEMFRGRLTAKRTLRTVLIDLWASLFRILPPYPQVKPGVYAVGEPGRESPLLVTGNFELTVRRLVRAIEGELDAWILVVDSGGINVWCAAGGGFLTADKIIGALHISGLSDFLKHHTLILPQLCANGVEGWRIREQTGWGVHWGPARAVDIPEYLARGRNKTDGMRWVTFPLRDRLEMTAVTLGLYALLILIPIAIFWRSMFWPTLFAMAALAAFYAVTLPWLPGKDGLAKSLTLALIALVGMLVYSTIWDPASIDVLFARAIGITALSVFIAAELQGMSPLMRGEQANWGWEAVIGGLLAITYWLVPNIMGWR
ncbi:MAG: corrinoid protein-associated methyltransferase CpaM, partial [Chloroflexota bacterium]|nr:corrinoid protein-associated methyltransferase CpaM [Chloroflexota bacterium]